MTGVGIFRLPAWCLFLLALGLVRGAPAGADTLPFRPGEKLRYAVYWAMIEAGEATLEILPIEQVGDTPAYHFVMTARTSPLVEHIYPVYDRMDAYADTAMSRSLFYKEHKETRKTKDTQILFDWTSQEVCYSKNGKKRKPRPLMPGAFDPLSVFYFFRTHELRQGLEISRPVTDGKRCVAGRARVIARQTVPAGGREFDTWLVEPEIEHIGGVFEKSPGARLRIWVTADSRRIPVLIKSEVAVGSFTAELVGIEQR